MSVNFNTRTIRKGEGTELGVVKLIEDVKQVDGDMVAKMGKQLEDLKVKGARVQLVRELDLNSMKLPLHVRRALKLGGSVIVDAGPGIDALLEATPADEQKFSADDVVQALVVNGDIGGKAYKFGVAGALVERNGVMRGGEVIEAMVVSARRGFTKIASLARVAWVDDEKRISVDREKSPERVLGEGQFLVKETDLSKSNAVYLEIDVKDGMDLSKAIATAAASAGIEDYTVRASIEGRVNAIFSAFTQLPKEKPERPDDLKKPLVMNFGECQMSGFFQLVGTRTHASSRRSEAWKKFNGNLPGGEIYSPDGHFHGFSEKNAVGGHIYNVSPGAGSKVRVIIEPASVVQVVSKLS